jgi:hypothetical protein
MTSVVRSQVRIQPVDAVVLWNRSADVSYASNPRGFSQRDPVVGSDEAAAMNRSRC